MAPLSIFPFNLDPRTTSYPASRAWSISGYVSSRVGVVAVQGEDIIAADRLESRGNSPAFPPPRFADNLCAFCLSRLFGPVRAVVVYDDHGNRVPHLHQLFAGYLIDDARDGLFFVQRRDDYTDNFLRQSLLLTGPRAARY
jgi:hypothetical protein